MRLIYNHLYQAVMLILMLTLGTGCAIRTSSYPFDNDSLASKHFKKHPASYWETELRSPPYREYINLSWSFGILIPKSSGAVHYSTRDALYFYPKTSPERDSSGMFDMRLVTRLYPLRSITLPYSFPGFGDAESEIYFRPYVGAGYGLFWGSVEFNERGRYLGRDVQGNHHYGLNSEKESFQSSFPSYCFGIEFGGRAMVEESARHPLHVGLVIEHRKDMNKKSGEWDFSVSQTILGFLIGF